MKWNYCFVVLMALLFFPMSASAAGVIKGRLVDLLGEGLPDLSVNFEIRQRDPNNEDVSRVILRGGPFITSPALQPNDPTAGSFTIQIPLNLLRQDSNEVFIALDASAAGREPVAIGFLDGKQDHTLTVVMKVAEKRAVKTPCHPSKPGCRRCCRFRRCR